MKEKDLQYALDWIAIQELVAEYGQAIDSGRDTGDWSRWAKVFTPRVTADYSRFMGGEPLHFTNHELAELGRVSVACFRRVQHATANTVRIHFKSDTTAEVMAYSEVAHYFELGGIPQEWTIIARYTHEVEKGAEGWKIRKVLLDPVHYRGNPVGLEMVKGKRLV